MSEKNLRHAPKFTLRLENTIWKDLEQCKNILKVKSYNKTFAVLIPEYLKLKKEVLKLDELHKKELQTVQENYNKKLKDITEAYRKELKTLKNEISFYEKKFQKVQKFKQRAKRFEQEFLIVSTNLKQFVKILD
jgi:uncharacterized protein involved in exopolysaccharide biosynthesis